MSLMRTYRRALGLSQSAFAAQLNVPLETYRPWDAGRRDPPPQLLTRARTLAGYPDETVLLPLPVLALMIGVHVRTLHAAARSGRLGVAYETRTTFRRLRPRATLQHALDFRRHYYGTQRRPPATRRCCMNRHWPARCQPAGSSPADAIRRWSAEGGHPIEDFTAEDDLTPLPSWTPGAKAIADDGLVAEERVLHQALTMGP